MMGGWGEQPVRKTKILAPRILRIPKECQPGFQDNTCSQKNNPGLETGSIPFKSQIDKSLLLTSSHQLVVSEIRRACVFTVVGFCLLEMLMIMELQPLFEVVVCVNNQLRGFLKEKLVWLCETDPPQWNPLLPLHDMDVISSVPGCCPRAIYLRYLYKNKLYRDEAG